MNAARPAPHLPRWGTNDGYVTVQFVGSVGLSFVLLVAIANFVVFSYGRGAVRSALDEGVRAGARIDASAQTCRQRAQGALDGLLAGDLGRGVRLTCLQTPGRVRASADVVFAGWLPLIPDDEVTLQAEALRELPLSGLYSGAPA